MSELTFGGFLRKKRESLRPTISLREFSRRLEVDPSYISSIETGRVPAPDDKVLEKIARLLTLDKQEKVKMYELAAKSKNFTAIPTDLVEYLASNECARQVLRLAMDLGARESQWKDFAQQIIKNCGKEHKTR